MSIWRDLLDAYLHDPPDKAVSIRDHASRARRYAQTVLGISISHEELRQLADPWASATERLPMPTAGADGERAVGVDTEVGRRMHVVHPLSAAYRSLEVGELCEEEVHRTLKRLVAALPDCEHPHRYLALWRFLPELSAMIHPSLPLLPADTRTPDHTVWHHLDITAGLTAARSTNHAAFMSFSLGPVQTFIASARTIRDLWTGSMILSWLTFQAMTPILERLGPTALVYPSLRGLPFVDLWLQRIWAEAGLSLDGLLPASEALKSPCLPNRFVAIVPWGDEGRESQELVAACRDRVRARWRQLAQQVHSRLDVEIRRRVAAKLAEDWDCRWREQIDEFFDVRVAVLPWKDCDDRNLADLLAGKEDFSEAFPNAHAIRALADAIPDEHRPGLQAAAGQWQYRMELSARLMEASKSIRQVPVSSTRHGVDQVPPKCSLLGTYEQMGPARLEASAEFWEQASHVSIDGVRLRKRERLSAVALVKRFAGPAYLSGELGLRRSDLTWSDTATVAAAGWLQRAREHGFSELEPQRNNNWSGQWLHQSERDEETDEENCPEELRRVITGATKHPQLGKPPAYYAILLLDGDNLGEWLRGDRSPRVRDVMHPKMVAYFESLENRESSSRARAIREGLDTRRHLGPALHAALSEALANFALHYVPRIVREHQGELIYAGGDDVLALLPTTAALACAGALNRAFRSDWGVEDNRLLMGSRATVSCGLAVVHHKEDLRFALDRAREAERSAKQNGRNALQLTICRRSGEHASALCPWDFLDTVVGWVTCFERGASDRWAYRLRAEAPTLGALDPMIQQSELRRQVDRAESETRVLFGQGEAAAAGRQLVAAYQAYRQSKIVDPLGGPPMPRFANSSETFTSFVTLCQSASFLARGRDQ